MTRAWLFLLLAASLAATAVQLTRVRTDIGDFFFSRDEQDPGLRLGRLQSDELARRYLISIDHPSVDAATTDHFISTLQQTLSDSARVARVWTEPFSQRDIQQLLQLYAPFQRQLLSLNPADQAGILTSDENMAVQAGVIKEALLGPDPTRIKALLAADPMLLTLAWLQRIGQFYSPPVSDPAYSVFSLETVAAGLDTTVQQAFQQALAEAFNTLNQHYGNRFSLQYTGVPVFAVTIRQQVTQDITRISLLSTGVVILLSWLLFRSFRALLCISILLLVTASIAALLTQWLYGYLHGLTLALGTTLIGICLDYFIHGMVQAGDAQGAQRLQAIRRIWPALLIGGATTLIGYLALSLSGFPGLQQVALFTGSGILVALLLTRYILPDLMALLRVQVRPGINLSGLARARIGNRWRMTVVLLASGLLVAGVSQLHWRDDPANFAASIQQLMQTDTRIRSRLSSVEPGRFILITANNTEAALQTAEQVQRRLAVLQQQGSLQAYFPLFPWLASAQLQGHNRQAWNAALNTDSRTRWTDALTAAGLNAAAFPPLAVADEALLEPEQVLQSPAGTLLRTQLQQDEHGATAVIWLGKHRPEAISAALQDLPRARYFSQKDTIAQLARDYRRQAQYMLLWGLLAILALLAVRYRSLVKALRVLTPAGVSIMLLVGLWGLSGAPLGMLHLIGLLLTAAVCVDYGVFFLENSDANQGRTFQAITVSAITTAAAFACLGAAENPALHALAWTVAPGVLIGFLLCPVMLGDTGRKP